MTRQHYKNHSSNNHPRHPKQKSGGAFKWMLITGLLIGLVVFAVYLKDVGLKKLQQRVFANQNSITTIVPDKAPEKTSALSPEKISQLEQQPDVALPPEAVNELERAVPQFDFYTILSEKEVLVPEQEMITRTHEERVNPVAATVVTTVTTDSIETPAATSQSKPSVTYLIQAGSFKNSTDAEKMRTHLASMGIDARIERAKVGESVVNRIKMGPYTQMSSVSTIRTRLRQNGIDVIVTEIGGR